MRSTALAVLLLLFPAIGLSADSGLQVDDPIRFNRSIRPLLARNCLACHGPDSASREADLRLDDREGVIDSGMLVPGNAAGSELIERVTSDDPELVMPPPTARSQLSDDEKELLVRWVNAGAEYEKHWSFISPRRPQLPQPAGVGSWAVNPIDHFVLAQLHASGLQPSDPADSYTLARRASLDLTGLPPDEQLLQELVADASARYGQYIRSLIALPAAGEHRARFWLDAARYGDTHGMHVDNYREIWPYRDWVIRAFTDNMPFDQFVVEQIAGDLLDDPSLEQQIATGFSRCNITTSEGGAISEEVQVRYMVDRVETTATVFLGLTAGCAVCHDHKFDPISQREFYQLGAFFNNTTQPAMDGNQRDTPPVVTLPDDAYREEWHELMTLRAALRRELTEHDPAGEADWDKRNRDHEQLLSSDGLLLSLPLTKGETPAVDLPTGGAWSTDHPAGSRGIRFGSESELQYDLPGLRTDEPLTVSFWFRTPDQVTSSTLFDQTIQITETVEETEDGETKEVEKKKTVGWRINTGVQSELTFEMFDMQGQRIRALLPDNEALTPRTWQHVCVRYSGGQSQSSITIYVNGRAVAIRHGSEALIDATDLAKAPLKIGSKLATAAMSDVRIYRRWINDREVQLLADDYRLRAVVTSDRSWSELDSAERTRFGSYFAETLAPDFRATAARLAVTQLRRDYIYARSTTTLVMQERESAARAWVLQRGEYDQRLDEVAPGVPAVLPPLDNQAPRNRLGLAKWLVDSQNPLTARVMVNRLWQSLFGVGLVKTSEDFGVMGERPSHPDLLDWLAVEFVESGWDINHMLELMATSATYRQSSSVTTEKYSLDPENRLLARGPRLRLDAEVLRDQALAISGLLRTEVGGPSVRPYQPSGLWKVVAIVGSNTAQFKQDSGQALYRRSLYTFWKRTSPPPSMSAFNAPTREQCTVRRERTNTPLQALVMMNDPQYFEAARRLAENALRQHQDPAQLARWMMTSVLSRPADESSVGEILIAAEQFRAIFDVDQEAAAKLIHTGESEPQSSLDAAELATWTMVANTLMNRDDFINK